jgi:tetratricopeptide (TPR) repeat protein
MADTKIIPPEIDKWTQQLVLDPKSKVFAQLADGYRKIGMIDEAIETCKRGIEHNPNFATGHLVLGRCYLTKKMFALAVEEFQLVVKSDPQNLAGYKMLATSYEEQGQNEEAIRYYQRILDLEPGESDIMDKIEKLKGAS